MNLNVGLQKLINKQKLPLYVLYPNYNSLISSYAQSVICTYLVGDMIGQENVTCCGYLFNTSDGLNDIISSTVSGDSM